MSFWKNVIDELDYQGKTRKWLASEANFDVSTIGTGLKRVGMPQADLAIRIAQALNVSVEYLVTGINENKKTEKTELLEDVRLYRKYSTVITELESLPEKKRELLQEAFLKMIEAAK